MKKVKIYIIVMLVLVFAVSCDADSINDMASALGNLGNPLFYNQPAVTVSVIEKANTIIDISKTSEEGLMTNAVDCFLAALGNAMNNNDSKENVKQELSTKSDYVPDDIGNITTIVFWLQKAVGNDADSLLNIQTRADSGQATVSDVVTYELLKNAVEESVMTLIDQYMETGDLDSLLNISNLSRIAEVLKAVGFMNDIDIDLIKLINF